MKKSDLATGVIYALAGLACLSLAVLTESRLDGLLWGFSGACLFPGLMMIYKYFYWSAPRNRQRYQEKLENEKIELHDELNEKIRDKSGRYAYVLGLLALCVSMAAVSILGALEVIGDPRTIVLTLGAFLAFQIISGIVIFNLLRKKY